MFTGCKSLTNLNLKSFDTSNVREMSNMFKNCQSLKHLDLSNFNVNNVIDMTSMFLGCSSLRLLHFKYNSTKVRCANMFDGCPAQISNF